MKTTSDELNWIYKPIVTESEKIGDILSEVGSSELHKIANNILSTLLINERGLFSITEQNNISENKTGIKNKYNDFNVEHFMGYEIKKKPNGEIHIIYKKNRPARICNSEGCNIEKIMYEENFAYSKASRLLENLIKGKLENPKGHNIIAEYKDGSKYILKDKDIYFIGFSPILIPNQEVEAVKNMNEDQCLEYLEAHQKNEEFHYANDEDFEKSYMLTFSKVIEQTTNALSHGKAIDKGEYLIINNVFIDPKDRKKPGALLISKAWLLAVVEAEVKAKDQYPSVEAIQEALEGYIEENGEVLINNAQISKMLNKLFLINKHNSTFMTRFIIATFKDENERPLNKEVIPHIAYFLDLFQENFNSDFYVKGSPIPSKIFLSLLKKIDRAYVNTEIKKSNAYKHVENNTNNGTEHPFTKELSDKIKQTKKLVKKLSDASIKQSVNNIVNRRHEDLIKMNTFVRFNIVSPKLHEDFRAEILEEIQIMALTISSTLDHINYAYDNITRPLNLVKGKTLENIEKTISKYEINSDIIFNLLYADEKLIPDIVKKHPEFFDHFKYFENKHQLKPLSSENYRYIFNRTLSKVRNSISHSAVSIFIDKEDKLQFCFNDISNSPVISEKELARSEKRDNILKKQATVECNPLNLFNFFSSPIFNKEDLIDTTDFFDSIGDLRLKKSILRTGEKHIFAEKGAITVLIDGKPVEQITPETQVYTK